jgi:serine/threonine-protein kinase RsbW
MLANRIHLTIDSNLADVFLVGLLINSASRFVGLDETEAYQMELCVVEAVNNTIRHAYGGQAGHEVAVSAAISPSRLEFSVADRGSPISGDVLAARRWEASAADHDPFALDQLPEGGMGLEIMREVMDQVDYESRGGVNCLRMTKRIPVPVLEA